ncbi:type I-F CRISPR-associated protein Csy1 [Gallibacterium genomosp. 3]|uniref:CRISPR-associated protein n=1 Tax=Gallibacterium genomosp. 3 TaxID=505345 RepID=A0A1A7QBM5_9PAST|nr:type I-F CRISPR-associated protein Csy1 [Gallibacterium genomosp. 3]OBX11579.1 CRISPR-associated protein [Gallibacterium genomosp. 3]
MIKHKIKNEFLIQQFLKKSETQRKKREKATSPSEIAELDNEINQIKQKYEFENWIEKAVWMTTQLYFGSHISKGIYPDSKGNNINFINQHTPHSFIGTHLIPQPILDATGNAAAIPLATFFNLIIDSEKNIQLRDLLLQDSPLLQNAFSDDEQKSNHYKKLFQQSLQGNITQPATYEKNKQILWPTNQQAISEDNYTCLVPLYPSSLANFVYNQIQTIRYSEQYKIARENRKKDNVEQQRYPSIHNLAIVKLGGTQPQNISQLNNQQGGKHYLLPSLPPIFSSSYKSTNNTIFDNDLYWQCKPFFDHLFEVVLAEKNVYTERDKRKEAITQMIEAIFSIAKLYQQRIPGWSKDYQFMNINQKYWLDPERGELEGEEMFKSEQEKENWHNEVAKQFAGWVNHHLKQRFKRIASDFSVPEFNEWRRIFKRKLKQQQH